MNIAKVLIVGGGIGGLCAAIALRRKGIDVDLVEIKTEWTVYGVGIIQQSNVVREMAKLGLLDAYLDAAYAFEDVGIYNTDGLPLVRFLGSALPARSTQPTLASPAEPFIRYLAKQLSNSAPTFD